MLLAFDTETCLITDTCKAPPLVCVSYAYREGTDVLSGLVHWTEAERYVREWLEREDVQFVGQNTAYDFCVLAAQFPDLTSLIWCAYAAGRVEDTMLREKLADIAGGRLRGKDKGKGRYTLEALALKHLGWVLDKDTWRLRYGELRDLPLPSWPVSAVEYPRKDAESTLLVYEVQQERYDRYLMADGVRQEKAGLWLYLMTAWGIATDLDRVRRLEQDTTKEYGHLEAMLREHGLVRDDLTRDTKAAKARMTEIMGDEAKKTDTGGVSLDKEACADSRDDVLEGYAGLSALKTILTKDIPYLRLGRIHSRFDVVVNTGRTSSSVPNIQNQRRKGGARECFVPRPGYVFVDADYDVIELRTFAQVCLWSVGESRLAQRINAGFDPHLDLGAQLLGVSYDEAVRRRDEPEVQEARQRSKPANFGYPGGMGAKTFAKWTKQQYGLIITDRQAQELRERWFANWPEAGKYFKWINEKHRWVLDRVTMDNVTTITHFVSGRRRGRCYYTEACNGYFQGLAADIGKAAGFVISRACYDPSMGSVLFGSRIVNFIHDEFLVEVPEQVGHECALEVQRIMVEEAKLYLPNVPATSKPVLCRRWSKDAKAIYDNGRLIPWDDVR